MASVRRRGTRVTTVLAADEARLLRLLLTELRSLLAEAGAADSAERADNDERGGPVDPLEQLTGMGSTPQPPSDPALARLLPDGYRDDPEAAAELRRFTHADIRDAKQRSATELLDALPPDGGKVRLGASQVMTWAAALNDLRLVLGTRLEVTEETEPFGGLAPDDPAAAPFAVYHWLTGLQDDLVNTLL